MSYPAECQSPVTAPQNAANELGGNSVADEDLSEIRQLELIDKRRLVARNIFGFQRLQKRRQLFAVALVLSTFQVPQIFRLKCKIEKSAIIKVCSSRTGIQTDRTL